MKSMWLRELCPFDSTFVLRSKEVSFESLSHASLEATFTWGNNVIISIFSIRATLQSQESPFVQYFQFINSVLPEFDHAEVPPTTNAPPPNATAKIKGAHLPRKSAIAKDNPAPITPRPTRRMARGGPAHRAKTFDLTSRSFIDVDPSPQSSPDELPVVDSPVLHGFSFQNDFSNVDWREFFSLPM
eukprot:CAMPEP_0178744846 /NCGR_PEP_ID=MMETSP0744-20121128/6989_1 /TAXON_ID=913974 /ORGANISM="Nitzschia punctata, Strain CCMP561" /LENGTH=185 /DNA_ID=CAMNT_0020398009 /DNA_START=88 /DNA_END=646 /DNA_ORIENTATION=+